MNKPIRDDGLAAYRARQAAAGPQEPWLTARRHEQAAEAAAAKAATNGEAPPGAPIVALSIPYLPDGIEMLQAALAYGECGWYVLPVRRGTKKPGSVVGDGWQTLSSRDPKQIAAWFAGTTHEIVLHCGRSGAVVFDVDHPDQLPELLRRHFDAAPFQSTRPDIPGRGHYVFAMPPGRTLGNGLGRLPKGWGEVRGLNGVIKVFPSSHADGGQYRWERT